MEEKKTSLKVLCKCQGAKKPKYMEVEKFIIKEILKRTKSRPLPLLLNGLENNTLVGVIIPKERTIELSFPNIKSIAWQFLSDLELRMNVNEETQQIYFILYEAI